MDKDVERVYKLLEDLKNYREDLTIEIILKNIGMGMKGDEANKDALNELLSHIDTLLEGRNGRTYLNYIRELIMSSGICPKTEHQIWMLSTLSDIGVPISKLLEGLYSETTGDFDDNEANEFSIFRVDEKIMKLFQGKDAEILQKNEEMMRQMVVKFVELYRQLPQDSREAVISNIYDDLMLDDSEDEDEESLILSQKAKAILNKFDQEMVDLRDEDVPPGVPMFHIKQYYYNPL